MFEFLKLSEFWFGAVVLSVYQVGKFSELNSLDPQFVGYSHISNLRTWDFAGTRAFIWTLFIFLIVTFALYTAACFVSPSIIAGWVQVTYDPASAAEVATYVKSVPYPLYLCALFMGLAHQAIPGVSRIANLQRNLFHYWIGVPRVALGEAESAATQIFGRSTTKESLGVELDTLLSAPWIAAIHGFADTRFYKNEIDRLKLDSTEAIADAKNGSMRELKATIEQLIAGCAIATVRQTGSRGLKQLAAALKVTPADKLPPISQALLVGALWYVFGLTVLCFVVPMLVQPVRSILGPAPYWPSEIYPTAIYILAQVVPILISGLLMAVFAPQSLNGNAAGETLTATFVRHAGFLAFTLFFVILYDYLQSFSDYGLNRESFSGTLGSFLANWLPYHALHAFISVSVIFIIIRHFGDREHLLDRLRIARTVVALVLTSGLLSGFYATARMMFQYKTFAPDFLLLVIALNATAALIAFAAILSAVRR